MEEVFFKWLYVAAGRDQNENCDEFTQRTD